MECASLPARTSRLSTVPLRRSVWRRFASPLSTAFTPLYVAVRGIIVPRQLKAYGSTFSQSVGERADHLVGDLVLQSLSPSRADVSPLLARPVKTRAVSSFDDMLLAPPLRAVLAEMDVTTPSPIQQTAVEVILQRKDTLVAAPHGEGKTLAYLLPLYQNMMKDRDVYKIPLRERRPRMILLAPTRELIAQLRSVCARLDAATGLHSVAFTSRRRAKFQLSRLLKNHLPDVIIMDPKIVLRLIRTRRIFLDDLRYVAVDEADALLSSQHDHDAAHLLMKVQKRVMFKYLWPVQTQTVFSTSFITRKLEYFVGKKYPNAVTCLHRHRMHRPAPTLRHRFYPVSREQEKMDLLQHVLRKHGNRPLEIRTDADEVALKRTPHTLTGTLEDLVERYAARDTERARHMRNTVPSPVETKNESTKAITTIDSNRNHPGTSGSDDMHRGSCISDGDGVGGPLKPSSPLPRVIRVELEQLRPLRWEHLTTLAAPFTCHIPRTVFGEGQRCVVFTRGIDSATAVYHQLRKRGFACSLLHAALPEKVRRQMFADFASGRTNILCATDLAARGMDVHVDVVMNFDMPTNALSYLQRVGRTARQGRLGRAYSFYTKHQGVIVGAVRAFLQKRIPLEGVSNWKSHMTRPRYAEWRTHRINAIARSYVSLITQKTIPAHLERTYVHHNATWRPLFHPKTAGVHGGVPPRQQQRVMDAVMEQAVWFRRGQLARRKGGRAKFGRRRAEQGVWNDVGAIASVSVANAEQSATPGGVGFGAPQGPPE